MIFFMIIIKIECDGGEWRVNDVDVGLYIYKYEYHPYVLVHLYSFLKSQFT